MLFAAKVVMYPDATPVAEFTTKTEPTELIATPVGLLTPVAPPQIAFTGAMLFAPGPTREDKHGIERVEIGNVDRDEELTARSKARCLAGWTEQCSSLVRYRRGDIIVPSERLETGGNSSTELPVWLPTHMSPNESRVRKSGLERPVATPEIVYFGILELGGRWTRSPGLSVTYTLFAASTAMPLGARKPVILKTSVRYCLFRRWGTPVLISPEPIRHIHRSARCRPRCRSAWRDRCCPRRSDEQGCSCSWRFVRRR